VRAIANKNSTKRSNNVQRTFRVLGAPGRFAIFMHVSLYGELCVSDAAELLSVSVAAASQHLKVMEGGKVLVGYKVGKSVCYKLNNKNSLVHSLTQTIGV